jgi:hypothetical protein
VFNVVIIPLLIQSGYYVNGRWSMTDVNIDEKSLDDLRYIAGIMGIADYDFLSRDELVQKISGGGGDGAQDGPRS